MIEQGLFQLVTQDAGILAAVGQDKNGVTKAFWALAPMGASVPFLVLSRVGTIDYYDFAGSSGLREGQFQIVCYASDYYTSRNIANLVRKFVGSYKGTLPDADSTVVESVFVTKDWDDRYEEGAKNVVYATYLQFKIFFRA